MEIEQPTVPTKVSRRKFLKGVAGVAGAAGAAAVGISTFTSSTSEQQFKPVEPNPTPLSKKEQNNIYKETDLVVNQLREEITKKIAGSPYEKDSATLLAPLDFYEANKKDPYFSFGFLDLSSSSEISAQYDAFHKTILIRENFLNTVTSFDIAAGLTLYHELIHAYQDYTIRTKYADKLNFLQQYLDLYDPKIYNSTKVAYTIANFEEEAYMAEVAILDLLSGGKLGEEVEKRGLDTPEKQAYQYVKKYRFGPSLIESDMEPYLKSLKVTFEAANVAFSSESTLEKLSDPFKNKITNVYRNGKIPHKIITIHVQDGQPSLTEI